MVAQLEEAASADDINPLLTQNPIIARTNPTIPTIAYVEFAAPGVGLGVVVATPALVAITAAAIDTIIEMDDSTIAAVDVLSISLSFPCK